MAWLSVPVAADLNSAFASPSETPTAPAVTSSGKPMLPQSWLRAWKKGGWIRRLSGTTLPPSTADAGVDRWISSLPDFPVSPGVPPGNKADSQTTAGSGPTSLESLGKFGPDGCFLKTSPDLFEGDCAPSSVTLPRWGSMRSGQLSERPMWVPRTSENGCLSLEWPTPRVLDIPRSENGNPSKDGRVLGQEEENWPTPAATVWGGTPEQHLKRKEQYQCGQVVSELGVYATGVFRLDLETPPPGQPSSPSDPSSRRRLNPLFVEWLMGWPEGWSSAHNDSDYSAMASFPNKRPLRSASLRVGTSVHHRTLGRTP
jgi:hypothetical protein